MPHPSYSDAVRDLVLDTVWSLWAELGMSGWARRHVMAAVDLEPLIVATAYLDRLDARLLQEALDWCISNDGFVSAVRLRRQLRTERPAVQNAFAGFAATVRRHSRVNWPGDGEPFDLVPTGRSSSPDLSRPALVQLRLRAVLGVSARAEIVRVMLAEAHRFLGIAEVASRAAYGKDVVGDALGLLRMAGIVEEAGAANQRVFRLLKQEEVARLLGPLPSSYPDWQRRLRLMLSFMDFATSAPAEPLARAAEVRRLYRELAGDLARAGVVSALPNATGEALGGAFEEWSVRILRHWSESATTSPGEVVYTAHRLDTGNWLGTVTEPGLQPQPIEMPEWAALRENVPRPDLIISDNSVGGPRLAHALFKDAFRRVSVEIGPYWSDDPIDQIISREFAEERLWPTSPGGSATFTEQFVRAWYTDRRARLGRELPPMT
jgi:hypothetical protein